MGVNCAFLELDKKAMRRSENMYVLSVFPKQADLTEVMALITKQMRELTQGITVMDFKNAAPSSQLPSSSLDVVTVHTNNGKMNVPFTKKYPRCANILGDAVSQAVIAGNRATHSTYFCRCCFCHQGSVDKKSKVYDVRSDVLLHNFCKFYIKRLFDNFCYHFDI